MPDRVGELALAALHEITAPTTVGHEVARIDEGDGVVSVQYATTLPGYPGWLWTVSVAQLEDAEPSVLEVEMLPAEGALLAPDWVPWSERLAEWKAAQAAAGEAVVEDGEASEDDLDAELEDDDLEDDDLDDDELDDDLDDDEPSVLHGGDLDGVDIDEAHDLDDEGLEEDDDLEDDVLEVDEDDDER